MQGEIVHCGAPAHLILRPPVQCTGAAVEIFRHAETGCHRPRGHPFLDEANPSALDVVHAVALHVEGARQPIAKPQHAINRVARRIAILIDELVTKGEIIGRRRHRIFRTARRVAAEATGVLGETTDAGRTIRAEVAVDPVSAVGSRHLVHDDVEIDVEPAGSSNRDRALQLLTVAEPRLDRAHLVLPANVVMVEHAVTVTRGITSALRLADRRVHDRGETHLRQLAGLAGDVVVPPGRVRRPGIDRSRHGHSSQLPVKEAGMRVIDDAHLTLCADTALSGARRRSGRSPEPYG